MLAPLVACVLAGSGCDSIRRAWVDAEHRALHGTWVATAVIRDGVPLTNAELARITITFHGPQYAPYNGLADLTNLLPDPSPRHTRFLALPWQGADNFEVCQQFGICAQSTYGRYERTGDTLRLCMDLRPARLGPRARPTTFAAPAGSGLTLLTLTRVK